MNWDQIKTLFEEFGWEVTSDFAVEYQSNFWTKRLLDAAKAAVDDRNEIESQIEAYAESREEAVVEQGAAEAVIDRLQALIDGIAAQPIIHITVDTLGPRKGVLLTVEQIKELSALATFPPFVMPPTLSVDGKPLASGGVIPAMKIWSEAMKPEDEARARAEAPAEAEAAVWPEDESS